MEFDEPDSPYTTNKTQKSLLKSKLDNEFSKSIYKYINDSELDKTLLHDVNDEFFLNGQNYVAEKDGFYFLACYDPEEKCIFFSEFITEKIITKDNIQLNQNLQERYNKLISIFKEDWKLIIEISNLGKNGHLSEKSREYFRRPIMSKFLFPERLELNNFCSTTPLPAAFQQYGNVELKITIHDSVCKVPEELRFFTKKVGFYYV